MRRSISPDAAPEGYAAFDSGVANKFVIDPHGSVQQAAWVGGICDRKRQDRAAATMPTIAPTPEYGRTGFVLPSHIQF
jgi:hypothetical protein